MQAGETRPIEWIEPVTGEIAPRLDVTGNEQARRVDAADAAAHAVGVEDGLPEELLATSFGKGANA